MTGPPGVSIASEMQALIDRMVTAYRAGDAAGCAALFTADAVLYAPGAPPARGRAAIEALHRDWTANAAGARKRLEVLDAGGSGDFAWRLAAYSEAEATGRGTSLSVLSRQPDGRWLIRLCSLNSETPEAFAEQCPAGHP